MADIEEDERKDMTFMIESPSFSTLASSNASTIFPRNRCSNGCYAPGSHGSISSDPLRPLERALAQTDLSPSNEICRIHTNHSTRTTTSVITNPPGLADYEVDFKDNDPANPHSWEPWKQNTIIGFLAFGSWVVINYSTIYTSSIPGIMSDFGIGSETVATLGVTTYLLGIAVGSLLLAPICELWGRRPVYIGAMVFFAVMLIPCALAKNFSTILICRFLGGVAGAAMMTIPPATFMDVIHEDRRHVAFAIWSFGPLNGPVTGPVIGGFVSQYLGWRWNNWITFIAACIACAMLASIPETYAPAILRSKVAAENRKADDDRYWCKFDHHKGIWKTIGGNLSRPFILAATEPILWFWDLYVSLLYGILYLCFIAYPLIFRQIRGWSQGISGLAFVGIGLGSCLAISSAPLVNKMIKAHRKDPNTGKASPEAVVGIMCVAAILCPVGQLIFAWTSLPPIPWVVPILAGIPFGAGNTFIFIYATSYIASSYGIHAASAVAGNAVLRSIFGATLPLAGKTMYKVLTPQWAGTLLGLLEVVCIPIPFIFYKYGHLIRQRSPMLKKLKEDQDKIDRRKRRAEGKARSEKARESGEVMIEDLENGEGMQPA